MLILEMLIFKAIFPVALAAYVVFTTDALFRFFKTLSLFKKYSVNPSWHRWDKNIPSKFLIPEFCSFVGTLAIVKFSQEKGIIFLYLFYFYQIVSSLVLLFFSIKLFPFLGRRSLWFSIPAAFINALLLVGLFLIHRYQGAILILVGFLLGFLYGFVFFYLLVWSRDCEKHKSLASKE